MRTNILTFRNRPLESKKPSPSLYTAGRVNSNDIPYGPVHSSDDGISTYCGKEINHLWFIFTNDYNGITTCRTCNEIHKLKVLENP
jgi:hypothetical protein